MLRIAPERPAIKAPATGSYVGTALSPPAIDDQRGDDAEHSQLNLPRKLMIFQTLFCVAATSHWRKAVSFGASRPPSGATR
ncbi:hypothetical protein ACVWY3_005626 [Bradyrhizobium sp. USDA 4486]